MLAILFSGKTLVCKEKAIQLDADAPVGKNVFLFSLLGAEGGNGGKPRKLQFVFDLVTKWFEFRGTNVKFVDVQMLCDHFEKETGNSSSDEDIYTIILQFIKDHPNSHFIFDEVPFIKEKGK